MGTDNMALIAHLMRRAGFGATYTEIEAYAAQGYDATVEALINPANPQWMGDYMIRRFHHEQSGMIGKRLDSREGAVWTNDLLSDVNGMSNTSRPLGPPFVRPR